MNAEQLIARLQGKMILQSQVIEAKEGDTIDILMRRKSPESSFIVVEVLDLEGSVQSVAKKSNSVCKRGGVEFDGAGNPYPHILDPNSDYCIYCGDGAPPPPPEAYEKKPEGNRIETMACAEHGSHQLTVKPDGSYDKPDCEMFKYDRGSP